MAAVTTHVSLFFFSLLFFKFLHLTWLQGGGGGPIEDDVTGLLVRSTATRWAKGSILTVDAGVHLAGIARIMDAHLDRAIQYEARESSPSNAGGSRSGPDFFSQVTGPSAMPQIQAEGPRLVMTSGPFKDLLLPHKSAKANALYFLRHLVSTYLITHTHLDHVSGFAINSAGFQGTSRTKRVAALSEAIDALKAHVFNDKLWPNLTDEEGGVGLVSFQRLTDGGNPALGEGNGRGYIEACDGLAVKAWKISHGKGTKPVASHSSFNPDFSFAQAGSERRGSRSSQPLSPGYRRKSATHSDMSQFGTAPEPSVTESTAFFILDEHSRDEILIFGDVEPDSISISPRSFRVWNDAAPKIVSGLLKAIFLECSFDDSQPDELLFGHLNPRHFVAELSVLADKVHTLRTASSPPSHLAPAAYSDAPTRKRKHDPGLRSSNVGGPEPQRGRTRSPVFNRKATRSSASPAARTQSGQQPPSQLSQEQHYSSDGPAVDEDPIFPHHLKNRPFSPKAKDPPSSSPLSSSAPAIGPGVGATTNKQGSNERKPKQGRQGRGRAGGSSSDSGQGNGSGSGPAWGGSRPLAGIKVVVIHVKDTMRDGPPATEVVLGQIREHAELVGLGCEVVVARQGEELYL